MAPQLARAVDTAVSAVTEVFSAAVMCRSPVPRMLPTSAWPFNSRSARNAASVKETCREPLPRIEVSCEWFLVAISLSELPVLSTSAHAMPEVDDRIWVSLMYQSVQTLSRCSARVGGGGMIIALTAALG